MELVIAVVISSIIGFGLGTFLTKQEQNGQEREKELQKQLKNKELELEHYRQQVNEHFSSTAEAFSSMTAQYRSMFDFMADQSQKLCDNPIQMKLESTPSSETKDNRQKSQTIVHTAHAEDATVKEKIDVPPTSGDNSHADATPGAEVIELHTEKDKKPAAAPKDYADSNH